MPELRPTHPRTERMTAVTAATKSIRMRPVVPLPPVIRAYEYGAPRAAWALQAIAAAEAVHGRPEDGNG